LRTIYGKTRFKPTKMLVSKRAYFGSAYVRRNKNSIPHEYNKSVYQNNSDLKSQRFDIKVEKKIFDKFRIYQIGKICITLF
jgi:hypothetical protein